MELTTCARPYARAAFEHARQSGQLSEWANLLSLCAYVASQNSVERLLNNPAFTGEQQADAFLAVCEGSLNKAVKNFIRAHVE